MKRMLPLDYERKWRVVAYVDGGLDPAKARAIERRMASVAALAAERDRIEALGRALRSNFPLTPPPAALRERIERAVGLRRMPSRPTWLALAASVALAVVVGSSSSFYVLAQCRRRRR